MNLLYNQNKKNKHRLMKNNTKTAILLSVEWHFLYSTELKYIIETKIQTVGGLFYFQMIEYARKKARCLK